MSDTRKPAMETAAPEERHGRDLRTLNEKLREFVASLRSERERPCGATTVVAPARSAASSAEAGTVRAEALDADELATELARAREAVENASAERERLRQRLAEIEAENRRICDDFVAAQERSTDLAQLYVALERIHGGLSRAETLAALQEIVINMIGCEELAIFELRGDTLVLAQSFGVDPQALRQVPVGRGALGRAVATGRLYVAPREGLPTPGEEDLTAVIPLRVGGAIAGAITLFRLLGHKPGLGEADRAVFDLLSAHAGLALHLRAALERPAAG